MSGTVRLRYESIAGQPRASYDCDDDLLNLRTSLNATYRSGPVTVVGELWDSCVYGQDARTPVTTGEVNAMELV